MLRRDKSEYVCSTGPEETHVHVVFVFPVMGALFLKVRYLHTLASTFMKLQDAIKNTIRDLKGYA